MQTPSFTPASLESSFLALERKLSQRFAERLGRPGALPFAFCTIALMLLAGSLFQRHQDFEYKIFAGFSLFRFFQYGSITAVMLSLPSLYLPNQKKVTEAFLLFALASLWGTNVYSLFGSPGLRTPLLLSSVPAFALLGWASGKLIGPRNFKATVFLYALAHWALFFAVTGALKSRPHLQRLFLSLNAHFIFVTSLIYLFRKRETPVDDRLFLVPTTALRGTLWPFDIQYRELTEQKIKLWWKGILNVNLGYLLLISRMLLERQGEFLLGPKSTQVPFMYLLLFLGNVGIFNVLAGLTRLFGYHCRDATSFAFLSRTPAEFWRRGYVYNYLFIWQYIHLPLARLVRSRFLRLFLSFLVFYVNRYGLLNLIYFLAVALHLRITGRHYDHWSRFEACRHSIKFLGFFLLLYVSQKNWFFHRPCYRDSALSWLSVASTHVAMIAVRFIAIFLTIFLLA